MKPRYQWSLVLLASLGFLGLFAKWEEDHEASEKARQSAANKAINLDFEPTEIVLERQTQTGRITYTISKTPAKLWQIATAGRVYAADQEAISLLLSQAKDYKYESEIQAPQADLRPFGLEPPVVKLSLSTPGKTEHVLALGDKTKLGYSLYFKTNQSEKVLVGSQFILMALNKDLADLRNRRPFEHWRELGLKSLSFKAFQKESFALEAGPEGTFNVTLGQERRPETTHATQIEAIIKVFSRMNASEIADSPHSQLIEQLKSPRPPLESIASLSLAFDGRKNDEHWLFVTDGEHLLACDQRDPATLYKFSSDYQKPLQREAREWLGTQPEIAKGAGEEDQLTK